MRLFYGEEVCSSTTSCFVLVEELQQKPERQLRKGFVSFNPRPGFC